MSRTDTAVRVISASPDRVFAALTESDALPCGYRRTDDRPVRALRCASRRVLATGLTYADALAARGKSAADSDVVDARFVEMVPGMRVVK